MIDDHDVRPTDMLLNPVGTTYSTMLATKNTTSQKPLGELFERDEWSAGDFVNGDAENLAERSEQELGAFFEERATILFRHFILSIVSNLACVAAAGMVWSMNTDKAFQGIMAIPVLLGVCFVSIFGARYQKNNTQKELIAQSDTTTMKRCLFLCENNDVAEAYRKKVIQSGRQLRGFDLDVMQALVNKKSDIEMIRKLTAPQLSSDVVLLENRKDER